MGNSKRIAAKNDLFRRTFIGCRVVMTQSVANHPRRDDILFAVRSFSQFSLENDPYGERDFGAVEVDGTRYFWKFDYYDASFRFYEEDGQRVLTIMKADEY